MNYHPYAHFCSDRLAAGFRLISGRKALVLACLVSACAPVSVFSADTQATTPAPGFRPDADAGRDRAFVDAFAKGSMVVLPSVVRTVEGRSHDAASAEVVARFLQAEKLAARAAVGEAELAFPEIPGGIPQFDAFKRERAALETAVSGLELEADAVLVLEFLITPRRSGGEAVGGIHCFVLTRDGKNAFSFLLNSHHELFANANLRADTVAGEARAEMIARAARVAAEALQQQIAAVRK